MKKITRATIKSFIKRNEGKLYIAVKTSAVKISFDGMIGDIEPVNDDFSLTKSPEPEPEPDPMVENNMGIVGAWFVGSGRDHFNWFENDRFAGYEIFNCCGRFILAIKRYPT